MVLLLLYIIYYTLYIIHILLYYIILYSFPNLSPLIFPFLLPNHSSFPFPSIFLFSLLSSYSQSISPICSSPLFSSIPIFILYVSVLGYPYLYYHPTISPKFLTPHKLTEWMVEVCGSYLYRYQVWAGGRF